ncbi:MAG: hypothetical protein ABS62_00350 [Microbacterium sp. SCN 70-200]|uniref:FAD-dependent oxidoreductase n=1 Tax=unclassified Microbacterium TaxID=2609290 RepID=UPI000869164C|nr:MULTISPECIES: FAD-dependent oxidoreductase [unclassified Microbacterium]MBN9215029.1 FAD-dependent oxidoreductase [Microbacterium sp.]ODT42884.1 MAG: hypothetical protein ABS62_00350 [Microbacterium sp. SCN 70-200]OJV84809.1 MAG: hypothetical protein BGO46_05400 [Microbacterium sp. 70-16]
MPDPSFLIVGASPAASALASALARHGAEVALIESGSTWPDPDAAAALAAQGVELRAGLGLVGTLDVGSHVEAELSDGHVENYDGVVLAGPRLGDDRAPLGGRVVALDATDVTGLAARLLRVG